MTTNPYPVDSTTRTCCGGIGRHTRDCTAPAEVVGAQCDGEPSQQEGTTMTAPADTAQTWRDFADQLTAEQIAYIEHWEAHPEVPPRHDGAPRTVDEQQSALLFTAREFVWRNNAKERFAHIAPPPGATYVSDWSGDVWDSGEPATRLFEGTKRTCGHMEIRIGGWQDSNGQTVWDITVDSNEKFNDGQMSVAVARDVAAALIAAADELERLTA